MSTWIPIQSDLWSVHAAKTWQQLIDELAGVTGLSGNPIEITMEASNLFSIVPFSSMEVTFENGCSNLEV